jgi:hypothetical protein
MNIPKDQARILGILGQRLPFQRFILVKFSVIDHASTLEGFLQ